MLLIYFQMADGLRYKAVLSFTLEENLESAFLKGVPDSNIFLFCFVFSYFYLSHETQVNMLAF